jgi:uncharacterized protein
MPRPRKCRSIQALPPASFYKPQGVPMCALPSVVLPIDGLEALRLADAEGLDQETAAARMGVSRPTFSRLLGEARKVVATALASGWALRIEGGPVRVEPSSNEHMLITEIDGETDGA